jgi:hypothetical protein
MLAFGVLSGTQHCGMAPTVATVGRDIWGGRPVPLRPLWVALSVALVLHLPLAPSSLSAWIRLLFMSPAPSEEPLDDEVVIPIELDMGMFDDEPGEAPEAEPPPAPAAPEDEEPGWRLDGGLPDASQGEDLEKQLESDDAFEDGGARTDAGPAAGPALTDAGTAFADAGTGDAGPDGGADDRAVASQLPDAGPSPADGGVGAVASTDGGAAEPDGGAPTAPAVAAHRQSPVDDPKLMAGGASSFAAAHPNVRIYIAADLARTCPLGAMFGELLAGIPQWRELLDGTGIDPVADFDHILISGPHMRSSEAVVATVEFNVEAPRMWRAVDAVVKRSRPGGKWLGGYGFPVAAIGGGGSQRAVLLPSKRLLVVLPAKAEDQIAKLKALPRFSKSGQTVIGMYVITPWRGFMNTAFRFPKSVRWLRLRLVPAGGDRFDLDVEALDGSAEEAQASQALIEQSVEEIRPNPLVPGAKLLGLYLFERPRYEVDGKRIRMHVDLKQAEVQRIMSLIGKWLALARAMKSN